MKTASLLDYKRKPLLKVAKSSLKNKSVNHKICINTLIPKFSFKNNKGEMITTFRSML